MKQVEAAQILNVEMGKEVAPQFQCAEEVKAQYNLTAVKTVALNGIRYLGSGSILPLAHGRYGMFFGAGNCLDNDSDGFHFMGYAETVNPVRQPSDLLSWNLVNKLDNPILSTDTVTDVITDPSNPRPYPLSPHIAIPIITILFSRFHIPDTTFGAWLALHLNLHDLELNHPPDDSGIPFGSRGALKAS